MTYHQNQELHGSTSRNTRSSNSKGTSSLKAQSVRQLHRSHPDHPICPNSLNCLPDTDEKPNHNLPIIVRSAILGSPRKRLTLREIYAAVENKFLYFRRADTGWKDSIRHNLSLNRLFVKVPRPATDPGFGSYWTVDLHAPPGSKRPRKRGHLDPNHSSSSDRTKFTKDSSKVASECVTMSTPPTHNDTDASNKSSPRSGPESEGGDNESMIKLPFDDKSAGKVDPRDDRGDSNVVQASAILPHANLLESQKETIARMESEISKLRRQLSAASARTLRVSEQLDTATQVASSAQTKLRVTREQLDEELVARVQAEWRLEDEQERRREVEEQLKNYLQGGGQDGEKLFEAVTTIQDISKQALDR